MKIASEEEKLERIATAFCSIKSAEECKMLLRDLCTLSEITAMAERLTIAQKVSENKSYRTIALETGTSTATITRVAHWLHHGTGGYSLVLERLKK